MESLPVHVLLSFVGCSQIGALAFRAFSCYRITQECIQHSCTYMQGSKSQLVCVVFSLVGRYVQIRRASGTYLSSFSPPLCSSDKFYSTDEFMVRCYIIFVGLMIGTQLVRVGEFGMNVNFG